MAHKAQPLGFQIDLRTPDDQLCQPFRTVDEEKVAAVKKALEGTDFEAIKSATEALTSSSYEVFGKAYSTATADQGAAGAAGAQQAGTGAKGDNVVDADYEVVDDEKK